MSDKEKPKSANLGTGSTNSTKSKGKSKGGAAGRKSVAFKGDERDPLEQYHHKERKKSHTTRGEKSRKSITTLSRKKTLKIEQEGKSRKKDQHSLTLAEKEKIRKRSRVKGKSFRRLVEPKVTKEDDDEEEEDNPEHRRSSELSRTKSRLFLELEEQRNFFESERERVLEEERMEVELIRLAKVRKLCEDVGSKMIDFVLSLCIERFYSKQKATLVIHDLRNTWLEIMECQWMDSVVKNSNDLAAIKDKIIVDGPCLPLNHDTWAKGVLEVLPNSRRQSVIDPFLRNDQAFIFDGTSTLSFTQFQVDPSVSTVLTEEVDSWFTLDENENADEERNEFDFDTTSKGQSRPIFGNADDNEAHGNEYYDDRFATIVAPTNSVESVSSVFSDSSIKNLGLTRWTPSQCDNLKGSGVFRYHRESSDEAFERLKLEFCMKHDLEINADYEHLDIKRSKTRPNILLSKQSKKNITDDEDEDTHISSLEDIYINDETHPTKAENVKSYIYPVSVAKIREEDETNHSIVQPSLQTILLNNELPPDFLYKKRVSFDNKVEVMKPPSKKDESSKTSPKKLWALTSDDMRKVLAKQSDVDIEIYEINSDNRAQKGKKDPLKVESIVPPKISHT